MDLTSPAGRAVLHSLRLDAVAAEVIGELDAAGIDCILLKGPVHAAWLYSDGALRTYGDIDLLLREGDMPNARQVLALRGFTKAMDSALAARSLAHEEGWWREADHALVELHWRIPGFDAASDVQWRILSSSTAEIEVANRAVRSLGETARLVHVAAHAAWHGASEPRPLRDLERAIALVPFSAWEAAAAVARELDALAALAAGLQLVPAGRDIVARLALAQPEGLRRRTDPQQPGWTLLAILDGVEGPRVKALRRYVLPSGPYMRQGWPIARRGRRGLAAAHVQRALTGLAGVARTLFRAYRSGRAA